MKIVLGLIIVGFCTFFGYVLSSKYTNRKDYYLGFNEFNKSYINNLKFIKLPLEQVINNSIENKFIELLKNRFLNTKTQTSFDFLSVDDKNIFDDYVNILGKSDCNSQENYANSINEILSKNLNDSMIDEKKYRTLYIKLGFLIGLIIFILIL